LPRCAGNQRRFCNLKEGNEKYNARSEVAIFAGHSSAASKNFGKSRLQKIGKNAAVLALHRRDDFSRQTK
jgi:hypothetical protein